MEKKMNWDKSTNKSQKRKVLEHLQEKGSITPLEALNSYGCFRLGAIIHTLRHKDGYEIKTKLAEGKSNYAIYTLKDIECPF